MNDCYLNAHKHIGRLLTWKIKTPAVAVCIHFTLMLLRKA